MVYKNIHTERDGGVIVPDGAVYVLASAAVVGREEYKGPLGDFFDPPRTEDDSFGMDSWESAEAEMQRLALAKLFCREPDLRQRVQVILAGDLLNQCAGSNYGLLPFEKPLLGLYGACSTAAEGMLLAAALCGGDVGCTAVVTSSHNCSAERQFRFPLEYGGQRTPTAQWTVTGAGAFVIGKKLFSDGPCRIRLCDGMVGIPRDMGISDVNNMGAAMAPAAADTLRRYFSAVGTVPADYDLILTGDLGREGSGILLELMRACGYELSPVHADAGLLIYGDTGDKHAGGSGCGCSASVMAAYVLPLMKGGSYKNVLFVGTGALMNPMMLYQGRTIPGIAHLVHLRTEVTGNDR